MMSGVAGAKVTSGVVGMGVMTGAGVTDVAGPHVMTGAVGPEESSKEYVAHGIS